MHLFHLGMPSLFAFAGPASLGAVVSASAAVIAPPPAATPPGHHGRVLFVDDDGPIDGDGRNWTRAFRHLQDALAVAERPSSNVREIRVAQGVYTPDRGAFAIPLDRDETFFLVDGVKMRGGYRGRFAGPGNPNERDFTAFRSELSGDLLQDHFDYADNSYHVVTASYVGPDTLLEGFEIREATYDPDANPPEPTSGALIIFGGSPLIQDCRVVDNRGSNMSGACATYDSDARFRRCLFAFNFSDWSSAGMSISGGNPVVESSTFANNIAFFGGAGGASSGEAGTIFRRCLFLLNEAGDTAGALSIGSEFATVRPQVLDCQFIGNTADRIGAAVGNAIFRRCEFRNNLAWTDSGAYGGTGLLVECVFDGNETAGLGGGVSSGAGHFVSCVFRNNRATAQDGASGALHFWFPPASVTNCLFVGNESANGAGAISIDDGPFIESVHVTNCTIVGNIGSGSRSQAVVGPAVVRNTIIWENLGGSLSSAASAEFSCVQGGWAGNQVIAHDPRFFNASGVDGILGTSDDDLRLKRISPCIDAGSNELLPLDIGDLDSDGNVFETLPLDFARNRRIRSGHWSAPPIVDMGALEFVRFHSLPAANLVPWPMNHE